MRLHYYVHGRGRGHASRARDVIPELARHAVEVEVFGGGDAADLLADHPRWRSRARVRPGPLSVPTLSARTLRDVATFRRQMPHVVVSDGDQPSLLAARLLGIPSVAVGHDLALTACELPIGVNGWWRLQQTVNALPALVADRLVAVHFLPVRAARANVAVARPDCSELAGVEAPDDRVLCYFRDGNGARVVRLLVAAGARVAWFGPDARAAPGVLAFPFTARAFRTALLRCRAVVASAGSNLLAECVALNKPLLALHRAHDSEQALNAELAERAAVAQRAQLDRLRADDIERFLARVREGGFAHVDLRAALPPVSQVVAEVVLELLRERYPHAALSCA
jgi:UDP:flavonoid glycosyltransferase YjiC (YdhE family)